MKAPKKVGATQTGKRLHLFRPAEILRGDILLSCRPTKKSRAISVATVSRFSHAAIAVETGILIEAQGGGVRRLNSARLAVRNPKNVCLLRLNPSVPGADAISTRAAVEAESFLARGYWLAGAIASVTSTQLAEDSRVFCSQLVALAYKAAGVELIPGVTADKIYPGKLLESSLLKAVDRASLLEAVSAGVAEGLELIDGKEHVRSPHDDEISLIQTIHETVAPMFKQVAVDPKTFDEALRALFELRSHPAALSIDEKFARILHQSGYLALMATMVQRIRLESSQILAETRSLVEMGFSHELARDRLKDLRRRLANAGEQIDRRELQRRAFENGAYVTKFATFLALADLNAKASIAYRQSVDDERTAAGILERYLSDESKAT